MGLALLVKAAWLSHVQRLSPRYSYKPYKSQRINSNSPCGVEVHLHFT